MKLDEFGNYWNQVYQGEIKFESKTDNKTLPWDIKTYDPNLKTFLDQTKLKGLALDVGCGLGFDTLYLTKRNFNVVGIDISPKAIEETKKNVNKNKVKLIVGNIFDFENNEKFDLIYDRGLAHNVQNNIDELFEKYANLLKKDGYILLITGNSNSNPSKYTEPTYTKLSLIENACRDNLKIISAEEIVFETHTDYDNSLGWKVILKKKEYKVYV